MMKTRAFGLLRSSVSPGSGKTNSLWKSYSTHAPQHSKKTTILDIHKKFKDNTPLTMVTAYDYTSAIAVDSSGIDMILVGDSAGMVMMGLESTTQVTMEDMVHHCKSVKRGAKRAFLVGDMPFGSYEVSPTDAVRNATRLIKEGQMEAVKMEGGKRIKEQVKAVISAGIPVIGHIGLTPQTCSALGGFKVQGKTAIQAQLLLEDALELQECGVSAIVIEAVPAPVAAYITKKLSVPTIGIGAGSGTSGQVLVFHDMLGLYPNLAPKFSKQYLSLAPVIQNALTDFRKEVESRVFPTIDHSYTMKEEELLKAFPDATPTVVPKLEDKIVETPIKVVAPSPASDSPAVKKETIEGAPGITFHPIKPKKKTIAIIGGGSMGSLIGGKLASVGSSDIWMVSSWKEHVEKINREGLTLQNLDQSKRIVQLNATTEVEEVLRKVGGVDLAVVMVKSPHTREAALKAAKLIHPNGFVLTMQNGLGNREMISEILGDPSKVIQGITSQGGNILQSGYVVHTGNGETSIASEAHNRAIVQEIAQLFNQAGINTALNDNLEGMIWGKLIVNSAINPLTAILRVKNKALVDKESYRNILSRTVQEGASVALARGVTLPFNDPVASTLSVARSTGENISSMLKDVMRGEKTEVDAINGAIVREGDRLGVRVWLNRKIMTLVENADHSSSQEMAQQLLQ